MNTRIDATASRRLSASTLGCALLLANATVVSTVLPAAVQAADQQTVVLAVPSWGCPAIYQAASWATREHCVFVKPPAIGRVLDALGVQGNDYVKVAVQGRQSLWFSAVPASGPWQTWLIVGKTEEPKRAAAEAAAHAPSTPVLTEPPKFKLDEREVESWMAEGLVARETPISFKAKQPGWVCLKIGDARDVQDAVQRMKTMTGSDTEAAMRFRNDAVAHGDCWLMDEGSEGLDYGTTTDDEFRNVWLYRFPYGPPVIMFPHANGIGGWTATDEHP